MGYLDANRSGIYTLCSSLKWEGHHIDGRTGDVEGCCHVDSLNTLRPRQNGRHFADDTFKRIFLNQNVRNSIDISLKFVPKGRIHNITSLVQIMAWRRPGDKPLSKPMMVRLPMHIYASLGLNELNNVNHYNDVIMSAMASQITNLTIVYLSVYSGADQRKHQSSMSLAFMWGIHRWPVNSPHKGPVLWKMFPFDDIIMNSSFNQAVNMMTPFHYNISLIILSYKRWAKVFEWQQFSNYLSLKQ